MSSIGELEARLRIELLAPDGRPNDDGFEISHRFGGDAHGIVQLLVEIRHDGQRPVERGVRIGLELDTAAAPPQWLIPGLFYGENRPVSCRRLFPRYERGASDAAGMASETWSFRADRAATPAVFGWAAGRMAMVAVDERTALGASGIGFAGSAERTAIWADMPFREEPVAYRGYDQPDVADVRTHRWHPGEQHEVELRVAIGDGDRHGYAPLLRALWSRQPERSEPWVTIEEAAALAADGLTAWHYRPEHRALYETAAFERNLDGSAAGEGDRQHMHVGWVSGAPWAAQLLRWGRRMTSEDHRRAGEEVLDHIAENLSPSGTFWAEWTLERGWGTGWSPSGTIHANTIGQATLFFLRAMAAEERHAARHPAWEIATRSNLDAITARQRDDGALGTYHHAETGEVTEWEGAGALIWIAALLDGATRYGDPAYRTAAERAGAYHRRFVDDELIFGAPEDVHLAPTSEDGYNAVIAYAALYRATGDATWLDVARRAADWTLTFRYTYDVAFEPDTLLGAYGFRTRGTDQASPANQHLHQFGLLCTAELVELSRATGDDHYRLRAVEALRAWRQFVARRDGDFNARRGMVSERFYQTDCFRPKGSLLSLSHAWTGGVLLLACLDALEDPDALSD
ncbi:MAG TPA: hypothetical protein VFP30_01115 [Candidatus Limnocylindria bacterium]|nr:hypothetical protein [Candidatus Limnocylindria bacterium]